MLASPGLSKSLLSPPNKYSSIENTPISATLTLHARPNNVNLYFVVVPKSKNSLGYLFIPLPPLPYSKVPLLGSPNQNVTEIFKTPQMSPHRPLHPPPQTPPHPQPPNPTVIRRASGQTACKILRTLSKVFFFLIFSYLAK